MLLQDAVLLLAVAVAGLVAGRALATPGVERLLGRRLGLPPVVAYLLAGVLAGPGALGLVSHSAGVDALAELGVALLLFGVGIEFSLERMRRMLGFMVAGGGIQVVGSIVATAALMRAFGAGGAESIVAGFLVALSSTALVFKLFSDRGELDAPFGQAAAGILLFQDLALVPMILLLPVLAGPVDGALWSAAGALLRAAVALGVLIAMARFVLPRALDAAATLQVPELFPSVALLVAFGTALAAHAVGLSLPLGAFLAGLALSGTPHAHQVFAELLPLRDAFVALFFTSVGVLLEPAAIGAAPAWLVVMLVAVAVKGLITGAVAGIGWRSARLGVIAGCTLAQIGEFSFVLSREASELGILSATIEQAFLAAAVLSMAATPFLYQAGRRLALTDLRAGRPGAARRGHVVVVGYDGTGQAVARVLGSTSIPFVVLDMDPARVRAGQVEGLPVHFGDASRRGALESVDIAQARAVVVAVSDELITRRIVALCRQLAPRACVLVRAHTVTEIAELERLGASEVVPAEFEASIELFVRLLMRLGVPRHVARVQEGIIRLGNYHSLRGAASGFDLMPELERLIGGGILERAEVMKGSRAVDRSLRELDIRRTTGAAVLTIVREGQPISNPEGDEVLREGDLLVVYGPHAAIAAALDLFEP
jgi:CPA2 family monovalent cation:H+ antiporter-2